MLNEFLYIIYICSYSTIEIDELNCSRFCKLWCVFHVIMEAMLVKFALSVRRLVKGQSPGVEQWRSLILVVSDKPSSLMSTRTYTSSSTGIQTPFTLPFPNWPAVASRLFDCRLTFLRFKDLGLDFRLDILEQMKKQSNKSEKRNANI